MSQWRLTSALSDAEHAVVGPALQDVLTVLVDLSLQAKVLHWNLVGRNFRSIHLQLDDLVNMSRLFGDEVAERAVTIGTYPLGSLQDLAAVTPLPTVRHGLVVDDSAVAFVVDQLRRTVEVVRVSLERVALDPVSHDLLVRVLTVLEKEWWMWQAETAPSSKTGMYST